MTIRTSIDARALSEQKDSAPVDGETHEALDAILDAAFHAATREAKRHGLTIPNDDRWAEVDAILFGAIASANPTKFEV